MMLERWKRYMKKIDLYQCEICGTQFKNKEDCEKCEKIHEKELRIIKSHYLPFTRDKSGMPTTITLIGPDGKNYTYKR